MTGIEGRVALVTGASRGIGRAVALRLAAERPRLALLARDTAALEAVRGEVEKAGAEAVALGCDLGERASVEAAVAAVEQRLGPVELLVNNAGITRDNLLVRMRPEEWQAVLDVNLTGAFTLTQACLRPMIRARFGRIVSVASVVGLIGNPGQANYAAAKAGLVGFSKSVAREVAGRGITVNVVAPGFIETDMTAGLDARARERLLGNVPMGRAGKPEDVADVVAFLLSDSARYVTGVVLAVDGGMAM